MKQFTFTRRDVMATRIPQGDPFPIPADTEVVVVQMLGGNFTVETPDGRLLRIDSRDAEAIGLEGEVPAPDEVHQGPVDRELVLDKLRTVFDPEIPINVVDLGLIYGCDLIEKPDGTRVEIRMSMTAPGCGMGDVLREDVKAKLDGVAGISEIDVEIVWEPPWDSSRMSDAAKLQLGWL